LTYDFGDNWEIFMTLKKVYEDPKVKNSELPRVLKGAGYGVIEDCGGVGGLEDLVQAFKKKKGEEYEELSEWLGRDDFDINKFDIDETNRFLKRRANQLKKIYESNIFG
jgi:hypothetical protein